MILKSLGKDTLIYGGGDLVSKLIAFFTFPAVAAHLSNAAFGSLELVITTTVLIGMIINCGMNNAVQRFYWDEATSTETRPAIVSSGFFVMIAFGLLTAVPIILFSGILPNTLTDNNEYFNPLVFIAAAVIMVMTQLNKYLMDVMRLHFAAWSFLITSLISKSLTAIAGLIAVVHFNYELDGLLSAQAIILLAVFPLALFIVRKDLHVKISRKWTKELISYGYPFIFTGVLYWLFGSMDRWFLLVLSSVEEVGTYSVAFRFSNVLFFVSLAFGQAWSPSAIKIRTDNPGSYRKIFGDVLSALFILMAFLASGLMLISGELIGFLMPEEYIPSVLPLIVLSFGIVFQSTQQVTAVGISLEKKTFLFTRMALITALINGGLNYILIARMGALGASIATSISYVVLTLGYLFFTQKLHPIHLDRKRLFTTGFIFLGIFVLALFYQSTELRWKTMIIKSLVVGILAFFSWKLLPLKSLSTDTLRHKNT